MKVSEFKRWLARQGAAFQSGGRHQKIFLNGKQSVLSNHPSDELKKGTVEGIKRQLGLK